MKDEVIIVLGMSRSGTSCLTGLLEQAGVYLGDVRKWNRFNAKGNQENPKINSLQEDLFIANDGNWRSPPDMVIWSDIHKKIRDEIIRSYEGHGCWGLKDPRTLFCLEGWLEVLPSFKLIGAFRHPYHVAMSLNRRDNLPIEQGYQIWFRYNKKLLFYKNKYDFPVISFDSENYLEKARNPCASHSVASCLTPWCCTRSLSVPENKRRSAQSKKKTSHHRGSRFII